MKIGGHRAGADERDGSAGEPERGDRTRAEDEERVEHEVRDASGDRRERDVERAALPRYHASEDDVEDGEYPARRVDGEIGALGEPHRFGVPREVDDEPARGDYGDEERKRHQPEPEPLREGPHGVASASAAVELRHEDGGVSDRRGEEHHEHRRDHHRRERGRERRVAAVREEEPVADVVRRARGHRQRQRPDDAERLAHPSPLARLRHCSGPQQKNAL